MNNILIVLLYYNTILICLKFKIYFIVYTIIFLLIKKRIFIGVIKIKRNKENSIIVNYRNLPY